MKSLPKEIPRAFRRKGQIFEGLGVLVVEGEKVVGDQQVAAGGQSPDQGAQGLALGELEPADRQRDPAVVELVFAVPQKVGEAPVGAALSQGQIGDLHWESFSTP